MFSRLMFGSFVTLLVFLAVMYRRYPAIAPKQNDLIFVGASIGLALMAFIWRFYLVRRQLSVARLYQVDILYAVTIGSAFGGSAFFASDFRPAGYASLIYASFTVFTRALVVPSSARRSLVISILTFAPLVVAGMWLAVEIPQELPPPAFAIGGLLFATVAIVIATIGSRIIYGLRQKVSEAMQLGQYTLDRRIGEGGMGAVYRAHHALLRRPTAIKLLLPDRVGAENLDRFEREVQATSQLTHPNTVAIYDYGRSPDGILYYAMEYLDGIDLQRLVARYGAQPAARVAKILAQAAGALAEAHAAGMVHRDIKPANIILCERGGILDVVKVLDFGLVNLARATDAPANGTGVHSIVGTPAYLAPEAVTDPERVTAAADLYALGAVGYFLLAGKQVFDAATAVDLALAHVTQPVEPFADALDVPEALAALIYACLAKLPSERPATARTLAAALEDLPLAPDWPTASAEAWWGAFRTARDTEVTSDTPTLTITIDLDKRA